MVVYFDDILIYFDKQEHHVQHVQKKLICLSQAALFLKPEKCEFHRKKIEFLEFIVNTEGIQMSPKKIKTILEWPVPKNIKNVQSFLKFANFNRQFIEKYSKIIIPLTDVTKKKVGFSWTTDQQRAFEILKQSCANPPVFCTFRVGQPARIETDASDLTIRVCLCQQHDGKWKPVVYYSRKMSAAKQNYDIHDKKLLAIISALQQWKFARKIARN